MNLLLFVLSILSAAVIAGPSSCGVVASPGRPVANVLNVIKSDGGETQLHFLFIPTKQHSTFSSTKHKPMLTHWPSCHMIVWINHSRFLLIWGNATISLLVHSIASLFFFLLNFVSTTWSRKYWSKHMVQPFWMAVRIGEVKDIVSEEKCLKNRRQKPQFHNFLCTLWDLVFVTSVPLTDNDSWMISTWPTDTNSWIPPPVLLTFFLLLAAAV